MALPRTTEDDSLSNKGDVMSSPFIEQIKVRRTIYALGDQVSHTSEQLTTLIQDAIKHSPSSFNSQSSRAVILFGAQDRKSVV